MYTVVHDIERANQDIVSDFQEVPSTIVSDVIGHIGVTMDSEIQPAYQGIKMTGTAVTVKASPGDNLIIHKAITMAEPGDVLIIDADGFTETGHVGELMCRSCDENGISGLVIDGGYRDSKEIAEMKFPVFGCGPHPRGPLKQNPGSINIPIACGGVTIEPGDVIIGDDDGIAVVPRANAEEILDKSHNKIEGEDRIRQELTEGKYLFDLNNYDKLFSDLEVVGPEDSI